MYIHEKIEEIRKKPEHTKEKYVWLAVAVSMTIILITWLLSIKANFHKTSQENPTSGITESINKITSPVNKDAVEKEDPASVVEE